MCFLPPILAPPPTHQQLPLNVLQSIQMFLLFLGVYIKVQINGHNAEPEFYEEKKELKESEEVLDELRTTNVKI